MAEAIKQAKFIKADAKNNNNKFWYITLFDDASILTENGRVGSKAQQHPKSFSSQSSAEAFYEKKIKEKQGKSKGYIELKVVVGKTEVQSVDNTSLSDIALEQIKSNDEVLAKKLIRYLIKKNIHNIVSATTIEYDESKGTFSTPCGIVTQEGIDEARELIGEISDFIENKDLDSVEFTKVVQDYIQLIPRKVGRKFVPKEVIPDKESVEKEKQILDALTASLQQVITADDEDEADAKTELKKPKVFDVTLDIVTDKKIIDHVKKFYNKTRNSMHTSSSLKVKNVYAVKLGHMHKSYKAKGEPIGNIMELWHGTRVENVLSILKGGLIIPKSSAGHVTGRMFGDGVYFSDQSTKSLNYAQGYWGHGSKDNNCFMFLANVAMGKAYTPRHSDSRLHDKIRRDGYDSCYAKANVSSVRNNEMIVYDLAQCDLTYLVEFSD